VKYDNFHLYREGGLYLKDVEIVEILRKENEEYRKLEEAHKKLEQCLAEINKKKFLTTEEEIEKKKIQKQKLQHKDRMAELIREYKQKLK
jgi:hypothetical protein